MGEEWGDGRGGWSARGGLYILLGLFRVAMSPRNASDLRDISLTLRVVSDQYLPSIVPSIGSIVSVMTLHGWQNSL